MQIYYYQARNSDLGMGGHEAYANLVTLVHTKSHCENARPEMLLTILIIGVIVGLFINIPLFVGIGLAGARFARRIGGSEDQELPPPKTTIRDGTLRLLHVEWSLDSSSGNSPRRRKD